MSGARLGEGRRKNTLEIRVTITDRGLKVLSHRKQLKVLGKLNLENMKDITTISSYKSSYYQK